MTDKPPITSPRIRELTTRLQQAPSSRAFMELAREYHNRGDYEEAAKVCRDGLAKHPTYHTVRVQLARALIESKAFPEAVAELKTVTSQMPGNVMAQRLLGEAQASAGETVEARESFRELLKHHPGDQEAVQRLEQLEELIAAAGQGREDERPPGSVSTVKVAAQSPPAARPPVVGPDAAPEEEHPELDLLKPVEEIPSPATSEVTSGAVPQFEADQRGSEESEDLPPTVAMEAPDLAPPGPEPEDGEPAGTAGQEKISSAETSFIPPDTIQVSGEEMDKLAAARPPAEEAGPGPAEGTGSDAGAVQATVAMEVPPDLMTPPPATREETGEGDVEIEASAGEAAGPGDQPLVPPTVALEVPEGILSPQPESAEESAGGLEEGAESGQPAAETAGLEVTGAETVVPPTVQMEEPDGVADAPAGSPWEETAGPEEGPFVPPTMPVEIPEGALDLPQGERAEPAGSGEEDAVQRTVAMEIPADLTMGAPDQAGGEEEPREAEPGPPGSEAPPESSRTVAMTPEDLSEMMAAQGGMAGESAPGEEIQATAEQDGEEEPELRETGPAATFEPEVQPGPPAPSADPVQLTDPTEAASGPAMAAEPPSGTGAGADQGSTVMMNAADFAFTPPPGAAPEPPEAAEPAPAASSAEQDSTLVESDESELKSALPTPTLAELYLSQGMPEKALEVYREILSGDPDNEEIKTRISSLDPEAIPGVPDLTQRKIIALQGWLQTIRRRGNA